ncbi:MAG: molybdenum transporter, periplasmic molybdate-binding protein [Solirubrobacterales bacterium]|nr:molybdenum transporter, periplasmic molybdate-binding protein [Solirubrobacterales bacterium]
MILKRLTMALSATVALAAAGCGSDTRDSGGGGSAVGYGAKPKGDLIVAAASSLKTAFTTYGEAFDRATVRYSFAGSDMLAAQLRQGVKPDVFASANTKLPEDLFAAGLVQKPTVFAGNRLVIAVPAGTDKVSSLDDLAAGGVTIAAGSESVPVGAYTRKVLARLGNAKSKAILANVRSSEPDVAGVVGKLTQGAVDAGFVYITDVRGASGRLKAIELPASSRPKVAYAVAVVTGTSHAAQAKAFVAGLLSGAGQQALRAAGFAPPPA